MGTHSDRRMPVACLRESSPYCMLSGDSYPGRFKRDLAHDLCSFRGASRTSSDAGFAQLGCSIDGGLDVVVADVAEDAAQQHRVGGDSIRVDIAYGSVGLAYVNRRRHCPGGFAGTFRETEVVFPRAGL